ncbi:MAG: hypothetical protein CMJ35_11570 [Phycisphaerae bacterium]|nr:hypothetical protein [Phycisphaerae bacterium]MBM92232.1 hypothetical protein [Phycisphaerae bacterium]|tara:strand:- start:169 stop:678 length:510 start_codon:yes stop_codon:yes gene_type:complete
MKSAPFHLVLLIALAALSGCVCNRSKLTSASTDAEVSQLIETAFAVPMDRTERLLAVFELIDPDHILLAVAESEDSKTILAMLTKPGCHRWPLKANSTLRIVFDDDGKLVHHERWANTDPARSFTVDENQSHTTSAERKRYYTLKEQGETTTYRRVYQSELLAGEQGHD